MPYINTSRRKELAPLFSDWSEASYPKTPGELNYLITTLLLRYLGKGFTYSMLNEVVGVLECTKLELYRRVAAPYEDWKITENGDVYI